MRGLLLTTVLLAGCLDGLPPEDPGTVPTAHGACTALEGRQFQSLEQGECGLTPDGPGSCFWRLTFTAEDGTTTGFAWRHSDVVESGLVTCDGAALRGQAYGQAYQGAYDDTTLELVWDDRAYAVAPQ